MAALSSCEELGIDADMVKKDVPPEFETRDEAEPSTSSRSLVPRLSVCQNHSHNPPAHPGGATSIPPQPTTPLLPEAPPTHVPPTDSAKSKIPHHWLDVSGGQAGAGGSEGPGAPLGGGPPWVGAPRSPGAGGQQEGVCARGWRRRRGGGMGSRRGGRGGTRAGDHTGSPMGRERRKNGGVAAGGGPRLQPWVGSGNASAGDAPSVPRRGGKGPGACIGGGEDSRRTGGGG